MTKYYLGEFSLITRKSDKIDDINKWLHSIGSRQFIQPRPYKRLYKYRVIHFYNGGLFQDEIFDLGNPVLIRPKDSIITEHDNS
jgi:hypothetical protein